MDPQRTQGRFRQQQNSAKSFQVQARDIPDVSHVEGFTLQSTVLYTILSAAILISFYTGYKRYM